MEENSEPNCENCKKLEGEIALKNETIKSLCDAIEISMNTQKELENTIYQMRKLSNLSKEENEDS